MYRLTLHMLLPVPTSALLFESPDRTVIMREYTRTLSRLGQPLSGPTAHSATSDQSAVLDEDRLLTITKD